MDWLLYSVAFLFLAAFVALIYIRIKYPFWSFMDANHSYDWFLRRPGNPISVKPCRNKYVDRAQVKTWNQEDMPNICSTVASLLQRHLIPSDKILYECESKHIEAHTNTQISLHTHPFVDKPSGTILSYPVRISGKDIPLLVANYISHIAAEDDTVTRKLIATHIYNVHDKTPDKPAFLLKKDVGRCAGLRPLIPFSTILFYIAERPNMADSRKVDSRTSDSRTATTLVQVYKDNWHLIQDAIDRLNGLVVTIDIGSIQTRVKAGILFVYALMYRGTTIAVYFIEDALMLYEQVADHGGKTLRLLAIAAANATTSPMASVIYDGFCQCLAKIIKQNADYKMLLVDGIGANQMICKSLIEDKQMMRLTTTTGAYYFVNWAYRNVWESQDVFILV